MQRNRQRMKKTFLYIVIPLLVLQACRDEIKPRFPVKHFHGHDYTFSIKFNKIRYRFEEKIFDSLMRADTLHHYHKTGYGMYYYYIKKNDSSRYYPQYADKVTLRYALTELEGDTIYNFDEIGTKIYTVDKEQYFAGLRNAVKLLKKGEEAVFMVPSYLGYGYLGDGNRIPSNFPFKLILKIIDIKPNKHKKDEKTR